MHTFETKNATFICNGDFSGDVDIVSNSLDYGIKDERDNRFKIPISDLFDFVAEAVRDKKIQDTEGMTTKELLGL